ncbi:MAG: hypothetical protein HQ508_01135 [Candidatus Marinimicrobia bacterium]|nr:hypothetical protein [Candidatus Neomarinimicrobiota bacterium]
MIFFYNVLRGGVEILRPACASQLRLSRRAQDDGWGWGDGGRVTDG